MRQQLASAPRTSSRRPRFVSASLGHVSVTGIGTTIPLVAPKLTASAPQGDTTLATRTGAWDLLTAPKPSVLV